MKNLIPHLPALLVMLCCSWRTQAQLPEFYGNVHHVIWVVGDLDAVRSGWESIGFEEQRDLGTMTITENSTSMSTARACCVQLGTARVLWIEPLKGKNAFTSFQKKHGDGVYSLVHEPGNTFEFEREVARLKSNGIGKVQRMQLHGEHCDVLYAFAGTMEKGKYELGLVEEASSVYFEQKSEMPHPLGLEFSQYAFAILEPSAVSMFWQRLGFPAMEMTSSANHDKTYMGAPAHYEMDLGWQRHGDIVYEWCIPKQGPNVYEDHIKAHGAGFQHLGFRVADMDRAIAYLEDMGLAVSQSGGWGERGKPGSGRYAYIDTTPYGGVSMELLWSYK